MLKGNFVIITHRHKCSATDALQVVLRQCGAQSMHLVKFLLHDPIMLLPVRGDLPVADDEEFWSFQAGLNRARNPATAMEGTCSTDQSLNQIRPFVSNEQSNNSSIADPEYPRWATNHLIEEMDRILSHQFIAVRAVRIWRVAVTAPFRQEDMEMGSEGRQVWLKRPRAPPHPA